MCIIIDTNTLASVFKKSSLNHKEFEPVRNWIYKGKGKVVYGGSKYLGELKENYLKIFVELNKAGKAKHINDSAVNTEENNVGLQIVHADFDDQHLVSLLRVSGCKLICSLDSRAYPYFTHPLFFAPANRRPRIYSSRANIDLLTDRNIAEVCKPCSPTTRAQRNLIGQ